MARAFASVADKKWHISVGFRSEVIVNHGLHDMYASSVSETALGWMAENPCLGTLEHQSRQDKSVWCKSFQIYSLLHILSGVYVPARQVMSPNCITFSKGQ